eukprot:gene14601-22328_t
MWLELAGALSCVYCCLWTRVVFWWDNALAGLARYGIEVDGLVVTWSTSGWLCAFIGKLGLSMARVLDAWFAVGAATCCLLAVFDIVTLTGNLARLVHSALFAVTRGNVGAAVVESGGEVGKELLLQPMIPGVTLPLNQLPHLLLAMLVALVYHELGHALAAAACHLHIEACGVSFFAIFPTAFVRIEHHVHRISPYRQLRVFAAGAWHNLLQGFASLAALAILPTILSPLWLTCTYDPGALASGAGAASPFRAASQPEAGRCVWLSGVRGSLLEQAVVADEPPAHVGVIAVNERRVESMGDWAKLVSSVEREQQFCLPRSYVTSVAEQRVAEGNAVVPQPKRLSDSANAASTSSPHDSATNSAEDPSYVKGVLPSSLNPASPLHSGASAPRPRCCVDPAYTGKDLCFTEVSTGTPVCLPGRHVALEYWDTADRCRPNSTEAGPREPLWSLFKRHSSVPLLKVSLTNGQHVVLLDEVSSLVQQVRVAEYLPALLPSFAAGLYNDDIDSYTAVVPYNIVGGFPEHAQIFLAYLSMVSFGLVVVNLAPVSSLDGEHILTALLRVSHEVLNRPPEIDLEVADDPSTDQQAQDANPPVVIDIDETSDTVHVDVAKRLQGRYGDTGVVDHELVQRRWHRLIL